eukprot:gene10487-14094_t
MEYFSEDDSDQSLVLFRNSFLSGLVLRNEISIDSSNNEATSQNNFSSCSKRMDRSIKIVMLDKISAELLFIDDIGSIGGKDMSGLRLKLDLVASVTKDSEEIDGTTGFLISSRYLYSRLDNHVLFEVIPNSENGLSFMQAFDFIISQFTFRIDTPPDDKNINNSISYNKNHKLITENHYPNIVARGLEGMGVAVRVALKNSGKSTGHAIRYLGKQYTSVVVPTKMSHEQNSNNEPFLRTSEINNVMDDKETPKSSLKIKTIQPAVIAKAIKRKEWAENMHSRARTLTGAALYPVRWTGRKASEWANGGSDKQPELGPVQRVVLDTIGGLGNGVANICKGVTEAIAEVGLAIGDSAMHHSIAANGEEYAEAVTKCYVDAASEIGLAGYKLVNVASFGWQGIMLDAIVEGTTLLVALYDYLIGPVLLQGYMDMVQLPMSQPKRYFVVLRPWSISFYKTASDFCKKPYKIVPTSMLDTIPKLRKRDDWMEFDHTSCNEDNMEEEILDHIYNNNDNNTNNSYNNNELNKISSSDNENDDNDGIIPTENHNKTSRLSMMSNYMNRINGGNLSHIEICTVDCSTYLIYPPLYDMNLWYQELLEASLRVETISKRKSGAEDLAMKRRLLLLPKTKTLIIKIHKFVYSKKSNVSSSSMNDNIIKQNYQNNHIPIESDEIETSIIEDYSNNNINNNDDNNNDNNEIGNDISSVQELQNSFVNQLDNDYVFTNNIDSLNDMPFEDDSYEDGYDQLNSDEIVEDHKKLLHFRNMLDRIEVNDSYELECAAFTDGSDRANVEFDESSTKNINNDNNNIKNHNKTTYSQNNSSITKNIISNKKNIHSNNKMQVSTARLLKGMRDPLIDAMQLKLYVIIVPITSTGMQVSNEEHISDSVSFLRASVYRDELWNKLTSINYDDNNNNNEHEKLRILEALEIHGWADDYNSDKNSTSVDMIGDWEYFSYNNNNNNNNNNSRNNDNNTIEKKIQEIE